MLMSLNRSVFVSAILIMWVNLIISSAQVPVQEDRRLSASFNRSTSDRYGISVAISKGRVLIGAPYHTSGEVERSGTAFLYHSDDDSVEIPFSASDQRTGQSFGEYVSLVGDVAVIGAPTDSEQGSLAGAVYIFRRSETGDWIEEQKLTVQDGSMYFGYSLDVSENTLAVAALDDTLRFGWTYLYTYAPTGQQWMQTGVIHEKGVVTLEGDILAIGDPHRWVAEARESAGMVCTYRYNQATTIWNFQQCLTAPEPSAHMQYGYALDIAMGRLFVSEIGK